MTEAALRLARRVGYVGAGTVEFLVQDGRFYFLEMNTRIQVEHAVTEAVLGIDLVREQLLIAGGVPISIETADLEARGHAVECRINAEDPACGFLPDPGTVRALTVPCRTGVRLDTGYEAGDEVPTYYDSLLAKLIVWGPTREIALHRLRAVLLDADIQGPASTLPALCAIVDHPDFVAGEVSTRWFEEVVAPTLRARPVDEPARVADPAEGEGSWIAGRFHRIPQSGSRTVVPGRPMRRSQRPAVPGRQTGESAAGGNLEVRSPMHATVIALSVAQGDTVSAGQVLGLVEAMKMEHPLTSPVEGRVRTVHVRPGQLVAASEVLVVVEPPATANDSAQPEGSTDAAP
jgi:acetyl-CoA/propionyl-CoA carboxylase biotin carboxyl carrier protein